MKAWHSYSCLSALFSSMRRSRVPKCTTKWLVWWLPVYLLSAIKYIMEGPRAVVIFAWTVFSYSHYKQSLQFISKIRWIYLKYVLSSNQITFAWNFNIRGYKHHRPVRLCNFLALINSYWVQRCSYILRFAKISTNCTSMTTIRENLICFFCEKDAEGYYKHAYENNFHSNSSFKLSSFCLDPKFCALNKLLATTENGSVQEHLIENFYILCFLFHSFFDSFIFRNAVLLLYGRRQDSQWSLLRGVFGTCPQADSN